MTLIGAGEIVAGDEFLARRHQIGARRLGVPEVPAGDQLEIAVVALAKEIGILAAIPDHPIDESLPACRRRRSAPVIGRRHIGARAGNRQRRQRGATNENTPVQHRRALSREARGKLARNRQFPNRDSRCADFCLFPPCGLQGRMTPSARIAAAIEVLADVETRRRPAADALKDWGLARRFAGSGDRAAIASLVYDALRRKSSSAWIMGEASPRAEMLGALRQTRDLDADAIAGLFSGEGHASAKLTEDEYARL